MPSLKPALSVLAAALVLATPVAAQSANAVPLAIEDGHMVLTALGHAVTLPLPSWIENGNADLAALNEQAFTRFVDDGNFARLEIFPRGEGEAFWTSLYGARVSRQANPLLVSFRAAVIEVYAASCRPDATAFFQLEADDGDNLPPLGFVCGAYAQDLPGQQGKGEVMVMAFHKADDGMAMVYREWRGDSFDPAVSAQWPVAPDIVQAEMDQLRSAVTLAPAD